MPQIRCPNCGLTISLQNRKEMDLELITNAVRNGPKSFTYLLHATKLPRKTLSLRLRELCQGGTMAKNEGGYALNGAFSTENRMGSCLRRLSALPLPTDKRVRAGILLALLIVSMPVAAQVLATLFQAPPQELPETPQAPPVVPPAVIGTFTMTLDINDVNDLYYWQVAISFNPDEMKVTDVLAGEFPETTRYSGMLSNIDNKQGLVVVADFMVKPEPSWSGGGRLATITFGYFENEYALPEISREALFKTVLLNPQAESIEATLTLLPQ